MLKRGSVVYSFRGRDGKRMMVVVNATPDSVWIADGRKRPIQRPKRKNPRHVIPTEYVVDEFSMATNRELRRALAYYDKSTRPVTDR